MRKEEEGEHLKPTSRASKSQVATDERGTGQMQRHLRPFSSHIKMQQKWVACKTFEFRPKIYVGFSFSQRFFLFHTFFKG